MSKNILKSSAPLRVGGLTSDPSSADNGTLFYNTTDNLLKMRENGAWEQIASRAYVDSTTDLINNFEWQPSVKSVELDPSALSPAEGDRYLIAGTGDGDFEGQDNAIAEYKDAAWVFTEPKIGMMVSVDDVADSLRLYDGSQWAVKSFEVTTASGGLQKIGFEISIASDGVDQTHILLANDSYLRGQDAEGDAVDILKVNASGEIELASFAVTPASAPDQDYAVANKKYVDDELLTLVLDDLVDVTIASDASSGSVLRFDGSAWVNELPLYERSSSSGSSTTASAPDAFSLLTNATAVDTAMMVYFQQMSVDGSSLDIYFSTMDMTGGTTKLGLIQNAGEIGEVQTSYDLVVDGSNYAPSNTTCLYIPSQDKVLLTPYVPNSTLCRLVTFDPNTLAFERLALPNSTSDYNFYEAVSIQSPTDTFVVARNDTGAFKSTDLSSFTALTLPEEAANGYSFGAAGTTVYLLTQPDFMASPAEQFVFKYDRVMETWSVLGSWLYADMMETMMSSKSALFGNLEGDLYALGGNQLLQVINSEAPNTFVSEARNTGDGNAMSGSYFVVDDYMYSRSGNGNIYRATEAALLVTTGSSGGGTESSGSASLAFSLIGTNASGYLDDSFLQYNIDFGGNRLSGVAAPTDASDAVNKAHLDLALAGLSSTLQDAYDAGGGLVTTDSSSGSVEIGGTETLKVSAAGGLDVTNGFMNQGYIQNSTPGEYLLMKVADTTGSDAAGGIQIVGGYAEAGAAGMVGIGGGISQSGAGGTVTVQGGNGGADGGYVNINGGAGGANGGSIVLTASSGSSSNGYVALKAVNTEISVHENGELRLGNNVSDYMSQVYKHLIILPNDGSAVEVADLGYDKSVYQGVEISYSMASILGARVGTILITTDGSETSIADSYTETADLGVVFSAVVDGSDVVVSVDNDGQETDMRALIKKFQAVAFPTPAPTGTQLGTFASYDGSNLLAINLPSDPGGLKFIVWDIAAGAYLGGSWQVMTYGGTSFLVGTLGGYGYSLVAGKTYLGVFWDSSDVVVGVTDQFTI